MRPVISLTANICRVSDGYSIRLDYHSLGLGSEHLWAADALSARATVEAACDRWTTYGFSVIVAR